MIIPPELEKYITEARERGLSDDQIRQELLKAGWNPVVVYDVLSTMPTNTVIPITPNPPVGANSINHVSSVSKSSHKFSLWIIVSAIALIGGGVLFLLTTENGRTLVNRTLPLAVQSKNIENPVEKDMAISPHTLATIPLTLNTRYEYYGREFFVFSGNGKEVMYLAKTSSTSPVTAMRNNELIGEFLSIYHLSGAVDGSRVNYAGLKKIAENKGVPVVEFVINGVKQHYSWPLGSTDIVFSNDGTHYSYSVSLEDWKMPVIYDGEEIYRGNVPRFLVNGKIPDSGWVSFSPAITSQGDRVAIISQIGLNKQAVIIDSNTKTVHEDSSFVDILSGVVFSPNGEHYAYRAKDQNSYFIVVDGKSLTPFKNNRYAWPPKFNMDGSQIAYVKDTDSWHAFNLTGTEVPYISENFLTKTEIARKSPDSHKSSDSTAFPPVFDGTGNNSARIILDLKASEQTGEDVFYLEVNDIRLNYAFSFISEPRFDSSGKYIMFGARDGRELKWMTYEIIGITGGKLIGSFPLNLKTVVGKTGAVQVDDSTITLTTSKSGDNGAEAAWVAFNVTIGAEPWQEVTFNSVFVNGEKSQSLLTVYWDSQKVNQIDGRLFTSYDSRLSLFGMSASPNSSHTLGFRLDSFAPGTASVTISNIAEENVH